MKDFFIIGGCWAISFLFNGIEAGLTSIDPVRLRHHVKLNRPAAVRLDRLLKTPERLLVTVLLITNLADILALLVMTRFLVSRFAATGFFLAVVIALPVYLFVLSVLPKSLFRRFPFRALSPLARLLEIVMTALWPIVATGTLIGRLFLTVQKKRARLFAAREELKQITTQSEKTSAFLLRRQEEAANEFTSGHDWPERCHYYFKEAGEWRKRAKRKPTEERLRQNAKNEKIDR